MAYSMNTITRLRWIESIRSSSITVPITLWWGIKKQFKIECTRLLMMIKICSKSVDLLKYHPGHKVMPILESQLSIDH